MSFLFHLGFGRQRQRERTARQVRVTCTNIQHRVTGSEAECCTPETSWSCNEHSNGCGKRRNREQCAAQKSHGTCTVP
eukprot:348100-Prorocentrum_minimum.AAC.3